ncbi:helix-turn-helix domain-containing protein [Fluviibacter phosphoraccumulans]|uniref:helix-turn-helix domain-containing protein n=1 Tax=Fluviibacter phosphoraccumulans TaxID=1751046 RepID=UPI0010B01A42|nr:helix-turn-helix domain-containing protein [Fluviibacter phosphoraccumulans]
MSNALMTEVWKLDLLAPRKMVLLALADNANDEGTNCFPSVATIVEKCSMSERTVQGHLQSLEENGLIQRKERSGRSTHYTLNVERISALALARKREKASQRLKINPEEPPIQGEVIHNTGATSTPADSAGVPANPHSINTPAISAGVQNPPIPPQILRPTPADSAPITTKEPYLKTTTTSGDPIESCGGDGSIEKLHYPVCSQEECAAIAELMACCPAELRQKTLDEIEGARQAGVIKTNLVPFARGIVTAIHRGTFTVGHGAKISEQRHKKSLATLPLPPQITLDPALIAKGTQFLKNVRSKN